MVEKRIIGGREFYERVARAVEVLGLSKIVIDRNICIVEEKLVDMARSLEYCSNIVTSSLRYFMLTELIAKLYKFSHRIAREIVVGVDTGVSMAYAVIVDGVLLDWGQLYSLETFFDELYSVMCVFRARKRSVKIGINGNKYVLNIGASRCYRLEYVDENRTNEKSLYLEKIVNGFKVSRHVRSAIAIALRKGVEVRSV